MASVVVAAKFHDDVFFTNAFYAEAPRRVTGSDASDVDIVKQFVERPLRRGPDERQESLQRIAHLYFNVEVCSKRNGELAADCEFVGQR